jgi:maleate isomerase
VLTPSSNTRLEPLTAAMLSAPPSVTAHFSRFRVVDVGLGAAGQFDPGPVVEAAGLLADARVDSIVWSGTSGGWRGIADDQALCAAISEATGVPATTSTLALLAAFGIPFLDSVALAVWHALELSGYTGPRPVGWGRLFGLRQP